MPEKVTFESIKTLLDCCIKGFTVNNVAAKRRYNKDIDPLFVLFSAAQEYLERSVLNQTDGLDDMGQVRNIISHGDVMVNLQPLAETTML